MKRKHTIFGIVAAVVVVAAIFGSMHLHNTSAKQPTSAAATATNHVVVKDYMFMPATIRIKTGTTVTWANSDSVNHTITADAPNADAPSSMDIAHGKSYSFTFKKAGTYTYHCFPHPYMHGTVEVTNS